MSKEEPKSLSQLIKAQGGSLGELAGQARVREELGDYLRKHLPPGLSPGFLHCNLQDQDTLVVIATSPEWASRLRFESVQLADLCREHGTPVNVVKVRTGAG